MPLPQMTAHQCLRPLAIGESGQATSSIRGVVPAAPFCVVAQFYNGNNPVGQPAYAESANYQGIGGAREQARNRAMQRNPGLGEGGGYSIRMTTLDRATKPQEFAACRQAARAAGMNEAFDQFVF